MFILGIILFILSCILFYLAYKKNEKIDKINYNIALENKSLELQHQNLKAANEDINNKLQKSLEELNKVNKTIESNFENSKKLSSQAFENYCNVLDNEYKKKEEEYLNSVSLLGVSYEQHQLKLLKETDKVRAELDTIRATRDAAIKAQKKEQEIKEKLEFYCLCPKSADIDDIHVLERIKPQLHSPRILSMLIWSTYFQKPMTTLCNNVLGTATVCGIYKITNQQNGKCYIGQSVDMATRWKNHAKCGLGIDTPQGNKLYKAMIEDGIWNFSWELLEKCSREELDAKEKFYIDLYQAKDYGYNTTKGNTV